MGDYNATTLGDPANAPAGTWGNVYKAEGQVTIPAAAAAGATVDFAEIPRGARVFDAYAVHDGAATNAATLELGLKGKTGTSQDDADYFYAATALNAAARKHQDNAAVLPVTLDEAHYVRGTTAAATPGADTVVTVVVLYEYTGTK